MRKGKSIWLTRMGKDCKELDTSLCMWLGDRMVFLAEHCTGSPEDIQQEDWKNRLRNHGESLLIWANREDTEWSNQDSQFQAYQDAQRALRFVANNLNNLWD